MSTLDAAVEILTAAGYDTSSLDSVTIAISDLPGTQLARVDDDTIVLDADAAGWGWFIDATPLDTSEFDDAPRRGRDRTSVSAVQGQVDLLTVLLHELGHLLGLDHGAESFMADALAPGVRVLPTGRES